MAMSSFSKEPATAAKSFAIPQSGHKFRAGGAAAGHASGAGAAPAYVKVQVVLQPSAAFHSGKI